MDQLLRSTALERLTQRQHYVGLGVQSVLGALQREFPVYGAMMTDDDWDNLYLAALQVPYHSKSQGFQTQSDKILLKSLRPENYLCQGTFLVRKG